MLSPSPVILSEAKNPRIGLRVNSAKHPCICLKRNAETLRCAQGDNPSTLSIFFRYTTPTGFIQQSSILAEFEYRTQVIRAPRGNPGFELAVNILGRR